VTRVARRDSTGLVKRWTFIIANNEYAVAA